MFLEGEVGFWAKNGGFRQSYMQVNGKNEQKTQKNHKNCKKCTKMNKNAPEMSRNHSLFDTFFGIPAQMIDAQEKLNIKNQNEKIRSRLRRSYFNKNCLAAEKPEFF